MNETDLMFKEAFEDLKPLWNPKDGDIIYFEYSEKDKEFWKKKYEEAKKPYEPKDGWWFIDTNVEFKNDGTDRYTKYIKGKAKAWRARQEDLQEIALNFWKNKWPKFGWKALNSKYFMWLNQLSRTFWDNNQSILWFMYVMELVFNKQWNGKTWEVIQ